jgi:DNA repair exonuclease SbcCD ATPase subunit
VTATTQTAGLEPTLDEKILALEETVRRLADERDQARRERNLEHANARISAEMTAAMSRELADSRAATALAIKAAEDITRALCDAEREIEQLRADLGPGLGRLRAAVYGSEPHGWWRPVRRRGTGL